MSSLKTITCYLGFLSDGRYCCRRFLPGDLTKHDFRRGETRFFFVRTRDDFIVQREAGVFLMQRETYYRWGETPVLMWRFFCKMRRDIYVFNGERNERGKEVYIFFTAVCRTGGRLFSVSVLYTWCYCLPCWC